MNYNPMNLNLFASVHHLNKKIKTLPPAVGKVLQFRKR
ncbi:hypothetical protein DESME_08740 [Desulfitobacterium metallireducens DSM 15288]|uniref:Uncharacterized protein n=1 Tax=Desulfitobacterium metallireducens DSM 15288 TaxID=871968 RepID=W0EH57_9FIRM|nr:hypothetical protein DESME_08740 [Desulfitobacterium metallireducens DSM 15288]